MNPRRRLKRMNLFVLRIWAQDEGLRDGPVTWEGQVRRSVDGEAHYFHDLQGLLDWLADNLEGNAAAGSGTISGSGSALTNGTYISEGE